MIYGVSMNDLPAAAQQRFEATLARLTMPRATCGQPRGRFKPAAAKRSASMLVGVAVTFNRRSEYPITLNDHLCGVIGTYCRSAHVTYRAGAFDRHLAKVARGDEVVRLQLDHDRDFRLCSTRGGALTLRATDEALMFSVRARSDEGRYAIRCVRRLAKACRETSVAAYPLKFDWIEPGSPNSPGELIVRKAFLTEISLLPYGAHGGTYARIL